MGKSERHPVGAWRKELIGNALTQVLRLLPEDHRTNILLLQEQLIDQGCLVEEINHETWAAILSCCKALIRNAPLAIQDALAVIDPGYTGQIYGIYGEAAVAQVETEFLEDHYISSLLAMRLSGILVIAFYSMFKFLEVAQRSDTISTNELV